LDSDLGREHELRKIKYKIIVTGDIGEDGSVFLELKIYRCKNLLR
jgi:hypothetical protein